jgi:parvulin-like peptidyl-prolyl isomerase
MIKLHKFWFLLICFFIVSCGKENKESPILARVGEAELSFEQVKSTLGSDTSYTPNEIESYISRWVDNELLYQAALAEGIGSLPEIQEELRSVRRALIVNYFLDKELGNLAEIPETKLLNYYEQNKEEFIRKNDEYRYFFVVCKDRTFAQQILKDIRAEKEFAEIIEENYPEKIINSIWDSGYIPLEQVIPEIQRTIQRLKMGNSFGPVASSSGHIVFKLQEKYDEGTEREFDQIKEFITRRLEEEWYREHYQRLLGKLKTKKSIFLDFNETEEPVSVDTSEIQN